MANSRLNEIYIAMKQRCCNSKRPDYKYYGGRGITICSEWLNSENACTEIGYGSKGWIAFKKWALENGYADNLTIDRIDTNKGYSPENCRWVSMKVQLNNKRDNNYITYNGKTQTLAQWCEELNLNYNQTYKRIYTRNWSVEKAFKEKSNAYIRQITYKGKTQSLADWCRELNLKYTTMYGRITVWHWSPKRAFETK